MHMKQIQSLFSGQRGRLLSLRRTISIVAGLGLTLSGAAAQENLLKNPGLEEATGDVGRIPGWTTQPDSTGKVTVGVVAHSGAHGLAVPANTAVEQTVAEVPAGAYLARCWVKSEAEQPVTVLLQDPERPWSAYSCAETKVPGGRWVQLEAFCALDRPGNLSLTVGGMSKEFRLYHGTAGELTSPIAADDFELVHYEPKTRDEPAKVSVWDTKVELSSSSNWSGAGQGSVVENEGQSFEGTPFVQGRHVAG